MPLFMWDEICGKLVETDESKWEGTGYWRHTADFFDDGVREYRNPYGHQALSVHSDTWDDAHHILLKHEEYSGFHAYKAIAEAEEAEAKRCHAIITNSGWGVNEDDYGISYASKTTRGILVTEYDKETGIAESEWRD